MSTISMNRLFAHAGLLTVIAGVAACALAQQAPVTRDTPSPMLTTYDQMPIRLCVQTDATSLAALRDGRSRVILHVQHQRAAVHYSPTFAVAVVDPAGSRRIDLEPFSLHAERVTGNEAPAAQHFGFNLSGRLPTGIVPGPLCLQISVDLSEKDSKALADTPVTFSATLESSER